MTKRPKTKFPKFVMSQALVTFIVKKLVLSLNFLKNMRKCLFRNQLDQLFVNYSERDTLSQRDGARLESLKLQRSTKNCRANIVIAQPSMQNQDMPGLPLDLRLFKQYLLRQALTKWKHAEIIQNYFQIFCDSSKEPDGYSKPKE